MDLFWNTWDKPFKVIYKILLFVFFFSVLIYVFTYFLGSSFVINWEIETSIEPVKTLFESYKLGIFEFPISINNYVISQGFIASEFHVNEWPAYILLIWLGIFISIILALITDLSRFWFVVFVIIITVIFVGLKLDYLVLFNSYKKIGLVIAFVLYFPALYIFHFVKKEIGFIPRLLTHLCATAIFGVIIFNSSNVNYPFLHLVNYGIYIPLILTVLFAFIVGNEIVSGFLRIITSGGLAGDKNGLIHFLVISIIFLLNAVLVLLRNSKILEADMYVIGSFWLLTIASIIGIWGYRTKEVTYEGMFSFYPFGAILYICLAITSHLTISYFFISGNDSFVEVMEDVIIYSQLGFSAMFIIYVIANFYDLLRLNADVGKVLYKPKRMPYFISRFAGVIVILALFFRFNMIAYYQSTAGFYSGIGDLYLKAEDYMSASEYYKLSNIYSGTSHRANYALATLEKRNGNFSQELNYLKQAVGKNPTEFAYANLASKYMEAKRYFEAIFALEDGLERFPNNGRLMNNLGLVYNEIDNIDSAYYYLERSTYDNNSENESATNIYALFRLKDLSIRSDTLENLIKKSTYLAATNNLVVLANDLRTIAKDGAQIQFGDPGNERIEQLIYNYNKVLNSPELVDTTYLNQMQVFYDSSKTSWFQDNLNLANTLALYQQGEVSKAFQILYQLAFTNPEKEYFSLLGKLALSLNANGLAVDNFKKAFQNGHLEVAIELAFAYMENGELDKAAFIWRQIEQSGDSSNMEMAGKMIDVLEIGDLQDILNADTEKRFSFLAYRYREFDLEKLEGLALSFESEDIQAMGFLRLFNSYLELNQNQKAFNLLQEVGRLNISRSDVLDEIYLAQCKYAYHLKDGESMQRLYSNLKSDDLKVKSYLELFRCLEESITFGEEKVIESFELLGNRNPFFEPGVMESVWFFNQKMNDPDKGYEILLNAVNLNPFSVELNKAYALQCLKVGLRSYALDTKEELKTMMSSVMFKTFEEEFRNTMAEIDTNSSTW